MRSVDYLGLLRQLGRRRDIGLALRIVDRGLYCLCPDNRRSILRPGRCSQENHVSRKASRLPTNRLWTGRRFTPTNHQVHRTGFRKLPKVQTGVCSFALFVCSCEHTAGVCRSTSLLPVRSGGETIETGASNPRRAINPFGRLCQSAYIRPGRLLGEFRAQETMKRTGFH